MPQKNISLVDLKETITSDDILGKEVIDKEGRYIGVAEKVLIDPISLDFLGIEIDKGFLKKGLAIGKDYIEKVEKHAIFLNMRVAYEIRGIEIFDKDGDKVGVVSDIELIGTKNSIKNIIFKSGLLTKKIIPAEFIDTIGYSVLLRVDKSDVDEYNKKASTAT